MAIPGRLFVVPSASSPALQRGPSGDDRLGRRRRAVIRVSRLDGRELVVNAELIELIEATPDTHLTLIGGKQLIVRESSDDVVERVIAYRRRTYSSRPRRVAPAGD